MLGIKLSPVLLVTREVMNLNKIYEYPGLAFQRMIIKKVVDEVFDRPDKIANALAYSQLYLKTFKHLPPFYKKALRDQLESFSPYTLRKFKLKGKSIKLADMIKALRPCPRTPELAKLYKAIIENKGDAIEKGSVITEVLSDAKLTNADKQEWIKENLESLPLNATIRNLRNVNSTRENLDKLDAKIKSSLRIEHGLPVVKVANPFDILEAGLNSGSPEIMQVIDKNLGEFAKNVDLGLKNKKITILLDVSGSMFGDKMVVSSKYFSLLIPMLRGSYLRLYSFNTNARDEKDTLALMIRNAESPITLCDLFNGKFHANGGTALADTIKMAAKENPDLIIVLSDEISWADVGGSSRVFSVGVPVIAINPAPESNSTIFEPKNKVIKLSALDAKIFYYIPALSNFGAFKKCIKEWYLK
jgi:hypothetical protein